VSSVTYRVDKIGDQYTVNIGVTGTWPGEYNANSFVFKATGPINTSLSNEHNDIRLAPYIGNPNDGIVDDDSYWLCKDGTAILTIP
jgi:hypothetical protein